MKDKFVAWRKNEKAFQGRTKSFSEAIFAGSSWFITRPGGWRPATEAPSIPEKVESLGEEKVQTIQSLKSFAEKTARKQGKTTLNFEGTQLQIKSKSSGGIIPGKLVIKDLEDFDGADDLPVHLFEQSGWKKGLLGDLEKGGKLLFLVGDPAKDSHRDINKEQLSDEKWSLLHKMIGAMGLDEWRVCFVHPFESGREVDMKGLSFIIKEWKPSLTLAFGAGINNLMTGRMVRLTDVHGQVITRDVESSEAKFSYSFIPIFHPEFLLINPKMKRTTWLDLQKVIKLLEEGH